MVEVPSGKRASTPRLCVVSPCFDEAESLPHFHAALDEVLAALSGYEVHTILVDDGSRDETLSVANTLLASNPRGHVYSLTRNFGHQAAVSAGLDAAVSLDADVVIVLDSDLQQPPALIPQMLERWEAGLAVVFAARRQTRGAGVFKRGSSWLYYRLFNALSHTKLEPGAADFYLLGREPLRALVSMPERNRLLRGMIAWMGFPHATIHYDAEPRVAGQSKYSLTRMVRVAMNGLISFSAAPITIAVRLGLGLCAFGALYLVYVFARNWLYGDLVAGWASLMSVVLILGGAQLLFIGLIGQYISRIYDESKQRPLYLLKQAGRPNRAAGDQDPPSPASSPGDST